MLIMGGKVSIEPFVKAKAQLTEAISTAENKLEIIGAIKCFEYSFELSWKTMKRVLEQRGSTDSLGSPRAIFIAASKDGLIPDLVAWLGFVETRNLANHALDTQLADVVFKSLPSFADSLERFDQRLKDL